MMKSACAEWLLLGFMVLLLSGCATAPTPLYNYSDYSNCYYQSAKTPSEGTLLNLQKTMEQAIAEKNKSRSGRVPPGMYANLGYLYLKGGQTQKAIELFTMEKTTYPEATHFMDRVIQKAEATEGAAQ